VATKEKITNRLDVWERTLSSNSHTPLYIAKDSAINNTESCKQPKVREKTVPAIATFAAQ